MSEAFDPYYRWLGIPPKYRPPNHYRLLGLEDYEDDVEVIHDAATRQIAHVRTYQLGQYAELSQRILNELAAAKSCLTEPQSKAVYDAQLRAEASKGAGTLGESPEPSSPAPTSRADVARRAAPLAHRPPPPSSGVSKVRAPTVHERTAGPTPLSFDDDAALPAAARRAMVSRRPKLLLAASAAAAVVVVLIVVALVFSGRTPREAADNLSDAGKASPGTAQATVASPQTPAAAGSTELAGRSDRGLSDPPVPQAEPSGKAGQNPSLVLKTPAGESIGDVLGIAGGQRLEIVASNANDALSGNDLEYFLGPGAPPSATIDAALGHVVWDVPPNSEARELSITIGVRRRGSTAARDERRLTLRTTATAASAAATAPAPAKRPTAVVAWTMPEILTAGQPGQMLLVGQDPDNGRLRFEYRLPGETTWKPAANNRIICRPSSPGEFVVEIRSCNARGIYSQPVAHRADVLPESKGASHWRRWHFTDGTASIIGRLIEEDKLTEGQIVLRTPDDAVVVKQISQLSDIDRMYANHLAKGIRQMQKQIDQLDADSLETDDLSNFPPKTDLRTWRSFDGKETIQGIHLGVDADGQNVRIRRLDGREVTIPLARLSLSDQDFLRDAVAAARQKKTRVAATTPGVEAISRDRGMRSWRDRSGGQVLAQYVEQRRDQIILRRANGATTKVSLDELSADDARLARRLAAEDAQSRATPVGDNTRIAPNAQPRRDAQPTAVAATLPRATPLTVAPIAVKLPDNVRSNDTLNALLQQQRSATTGLELYRQFMASSNVTEGEKEAARAEMAAWETRVAQRQQRFGKTIWLPSSEATARIAQEEQFMKEAIELFQRKQLRSMHSRLKGASGNVNPYGIRSEFSLGLATALLERDFTAARRHFRTCANRRPVETLATTVDQANRAACLNNFALASVRLGDYSEGITAWLEAIEPGTVAPEIAQNIGRLSLLAKDRSLPSNMDQRQVNLLSELIQKLGQAKGRTAHDPTLGWLYMRPYAESDDATASHDPLVDRLLLECRSVSLGERSACEDRWCMHCKGMQQITCAAKDCNNGMIPRYETVPIRDVYGKKVASTKKRADVACKVCRGKGKVPCERCLEGLDATLVERADLDSR